MQIRKFGTQSVIKRDCRNQGKNGTADTYKVSKLPIREISIGIGPLMLFEDRFLKKKEQSSQHSGKFHFRDIEKHIKKCYKK